MQNLIIILPFHITTDKILKVIAKVVGCPFTKQTVLDINNNFYQFNQDLPSSNANLWYIKFNEKDVYYEHCIPKNSDSIRLVFKDMNGASHNWSGLGNANQSLEGKNFNALFTTINLAIGKRLVDFFGGHIKLDNGDYIYHPVKKINFSNNNFNNIKYDPFTDTKEVNYLWHLFENSLNNEKLLQIHELFDARKLTTYHLPSEEALYQTIFYNKLDNIIPNKNKNNVKKSKI